MCIEFNHLAHFTERVDGRAIDLAAKERVEALADQEAKNRQHGHTAVGHLSLTVPVTAGR